MPYQNRITSFSGVHHVIIRGVNKCIIFEEDADYKTFLKYLSDSRKEFGISIYCYCLMSNHVHLLIYDPKGSLPEFMHSLGMSYARYFNRKYERVGHLFQNRYSSKPVENKNYFYRVLKYILYNPTKAGICAPSVYRWSSYKDYVAGYGVTDTAAILSDLGGMKGLDALLCTEPVEIRSEFELEHEGPDAEISKDITLICGIEPTAIMGLGRVERDKALKKLKDMGICERQISRITGVSKSVVHRA